MIIDLIPITNRYIQPDMRLDKFISSVGIVFNRNDEAVCKGHELELTDDLLKLYKYKLVELTPNMSIVERLLLSPTKLELSKRNQVLGKSDPIFCVLIRRIDLVRGIVNTSINIKAIRDIQVSDACPAHLQRLLFMRWMNPKFPDFCNTITRVLNDNKTNVQLVNGDDRGINTHKLFSFWEKGQSVYDYLCKQLARDCDPLTNELINNQVSEAVLSKEQLSPKFNAHPLLQPDFIPEFKSAESFDEDMNVREHLHQLILAFLNSLISDYYYYSSNAKLSNTTISLSSRYMIKVQVQDQITDSVNAYLRAKQKLIPPIDTIKIIKTFTEELYIELIDIEHKSYLLYIDLFYYSFVNRLMVHLY